MRAFDRDPVAMVKAQHDEYVAAGLTILRAYHKAGRPQQRTSHSSFTHWSRCVRDCLIWLGEADPCDTMEDLRGADPKLEAPISVMSAWREVVGLAWVSVRDIIKRATRASGGQLSPYPAALK